MVKTLNAKGVTVYDTIHGAGTKIFFNSLANPRPLYSFIFNGCDFHTLMTNDKWTNQFSKKYSRDSNPGYERCMAEMKLLS